MTFPVTEHTVKTDRHTTGYLACGAEDGPLLMFCHGWPELAVSWRHQLPAMAALGFRCVAPDMRGYGRSSTYPRHQDFAQQAIVEDMLELLAALGRDRAVWIGHDWGSSVVWNVASHHPDRTAGVASLCVPYLAAGNSIENRLPLVDRSIYPVDLYPVGQWDYHLFYEENFDKARSQFEANIRNVVKAMFRKGDPSRIAQPAATASVRRNGGWFGGGACPDVPRDPDVLTEQDLEAYTAALTRNGFFGPNSWYMNREANGHYARQSTSPRLAMPVLFLHGAYDTTCETVNSRLAEPMRGDCSDLAEVVVRSGHWMAQEQPVAVNAALTKWLAAKLGDYWSRDMTFPITEHTLKTDRHTTGYLACGAEDAPLLVFCHGWPELSLSWRHQLPAMAALGFRCIAPDMRGYGRSSTYPRHEDFAQEPIVEDMLELLASLGRDRAVWIGHDWGSPVVWNMAAHHPDKTAGVASLCVPYLAAGFTLESVMPLVDRKVYPEAEFPAGQWDYQLFYEESFDKACKGFEANIRNVVKALFRKGDPKAAGKPSRTASVRRNGGWVGGGGFPDVPRDGDVLTEQDLAAYTAALTRNGFFGPDSWYMNHKANGAYARRAPDGGKLAMPALFLHGAYDVTCETMQSSLPEPMRRDCADLTEVVVKSGHWMAQEQPVAVNAALARWLAARLPDYWKA